MLFTNKPKTHSLLAVCDGRCLPLADMSDEVFASGMLGVGVAIEPTGNTFYSPVSGRVDNVTATGHAYTICTEDGLDVLVHIGVDTVGLRGEGFHPAVSAGQHLHAGDRLLDADIDLIRSRGYAATTAVIVTTPDRMGAVDFRYGEISGGRDVVMTYAASGKESRHD